MKQTVHGHRQADAIDPKRSLRTAQLAKLIVDIATGQRDDVPVSDMDQAPKEFAGLGLMTYLPFRFRALRAA
jgi:hypothetical protein